jgi:hypothetical protein
MASPDITSDSLKNISARGLLDEMKKYKSATDMIKQPSGKMVPACEVFIPIMTKYSRNYDDFELRETIGKQYTCKIDTSELHARLYHVRALLAQPISKSTDYACITLSIGTFNFAYIYVLLGNPLAIAYISIGGSSQSYDGEWRGMMTNMSSYEYLINKFANTIDTIVSAARFKQKPTMRIFHSTSLLDKTVASLRALIDNARFGENLLGLAWFVGIYTFQTVVLTPEFSKFCSLGGKLDLDKFKKSEIDDIYCILGSFTDTRPFQAHYSVVERSVRVGQKLIQLTPDEVSHPLNESYQAWNEILVTQRTLDLLLNMICPSFAIHSFWLMLFETSKFMYNIKNMRDRVIQSQTIRLTPNDKRTGKVLADEAVCVTNEYCGPTFRASLHIDSMREKTLEFGSKYVFELLYALFCLHSRLGQFHGDFHCDNATIMQLVDSPAHSMSRICYVIGEDKFIFPHDGSYGCVIDFSRTIHMDNPLWVERVIDKYELYFKGVPLPKDLDVYAALDDPSILEKLKRRASVFDIYEFALTTLVQCEKIISGTSLGKLLEDIKSTSREILFGEYEDQKQNGYDTAWPALVLLKKYWPSAVELPSNDIYFGIYTYDNPMKYSTNAYASLPRSLSSQPGVRDNDDDPIDFYGGFALSIKLRYKLYSENLEELFGRKQKSD